MPPTFSSSFLNTLPYMTYSYASARLSLPVCAVARGGGEGRGVGESVVATTIDSVAAGGAD
eukprot:21510-Pelagococcus_subviridis.AAC.10